MREMKLMGMPLGQTASQEPVTLHAPKPSASIARIIARARRSFSGLPWGRRLRWAILAATKREAEAFLQEATHAPQPMRAAASIERSLACFGTGMELASDAAPVLTEMKPPAWMMRSKAVRSTTRSLTTGKALAPNGSTVMVSPSLKLRM